MEQVQLSSDEAAGFRQTLTPLLQALLDGPLNPLKFCQENVVAEFEKLQLCECAHIIAANERTAVGSHNVGGGANRLDDFFPFDPLLLKHSSERVQPLYKTWEPLHDDPRESNCSSEPSASLGTSFQQMSVTPDDLDSLMRQRLKEQAHSPYVATMTGGFPR